MGLDPKRITEVLHKHKVKTFTAGKSVYEPISASAAIALVESDVGTLAFPQYDTVMLTIIKDTGCWEPDEKQFLENHVRKGMLVVNVGANVGYTSLVLSSLVGKKGLVVAIEPDLLNYNLLCQNLKTNNARNVIAANCACSDANGTTRLSISPDNAGDHRTVDIAGRDSVEVTALTLDTIFAHGSKPQAIICDAQGYDHIIIRGGKKIIKKSVEFFTVEFWPDGIGEVGDRAEDVFTDYQSNYRRIWDVPTETDITKLDWGSALQVITEVLDHTTLGIFSPRRLSDTGPVIARGTKRIIKKFRTN